MRCSSSLLCFLASTLLLTACGGVAENGGVVPSSDDLGIQQSELCSGASVTNLSIAHATSYGGELVAMGDWQVSYPANAVRLEYWMGGVRLGFEESPVGDPLNRTGSWYFSMQGVGCGTHTLQVQAYPMVISSNGTRTTCGSTPSKTASQSFSQSCPSSSLSCLHLSSWAVTCTGGGSGGTGSLTPMWQVYGKSGYSAGPEELMIPWYEGNWSQAYSCAQELYASESSDRLRIEFKLRDESGMESLVRTSYVYCKAGTGVDLPE